MDKLTKYYMVFFLIFILSIVYIQNIDKQKECKKDPYVKFYIKGDQAKEKKDCKESVSFIGFIYSLPFI